MEKERLRAGWALLADLLDSGEIRKQDGLIGRAACEVNFVLRFLSVSFLVQYFVGRQG